MAGTLGASPFFAMDTGISGEPAEVAATLRDLGYDGLGGSGTNVKPMREALEARGLELRNVYLTLKFEAGVPAVTPAMRTLIADLKGHSSALWIAIQSVSADGDEVAALREICDVAAASQVRVSLYPHTGFRLSRFSEAASLAARVERDNIGITFNLCHWLKVEGDVDPIPEILKSREKLQFVTVNGADKGDTRTMGWDRLIRTLDRGTYDTASFVKRLRGEVKWHGPVGLQSYGIPGDQRENLKRSMAAWRLMNEGLGGLVMCGYQGWFRCEGDGSGNGWHHYAAGGKFEPGHSHIDLWPDVSELGSNERFATPFRHADGRVAEVFSSVNETTIRRHFRWMREYGIDGVFLQRFTTRVADPRLRGPMDKVLAHCRESSNAERRKWALMYDMSGTMPAGFHQVIDDWKRLRNEGPMKGADAAYLTHDGKPLVALWGLGFNDRPPALTEWEALLRFFRSEGCAIMVGVPCYWRTLDRDTIRDPKLLELIALADIVSPWSVGRFGTPEAAAARVEPLLKPDLAWCRERGLDYLPVAFPGFSWHNLQKSRGRDENPNAIPRLGGRFLWSQAVAARKAGADSLYVAMFDELDEGTAIFKTSQDPPAGESPFVAEPELKSDHYLRLTGGIGRLMRGEIGAEFPGR